jgi:hypothetical protein
MRPPDEPSPVKDEPPPDLARSERAHQIIQEYANDLREIIRKLGKRLFH